MPPSKEFSSLFLRNAVVLGALISTGFAFALWILVALNFVRPLSEEKRSATTEEIAFHLSGSRFSTTSDSGNSTTVSDLKLRPYYFLTFIKGCSVDEGICFWGTDRFYHASVTYTQAAETYETDLVLSCHSNSSRCLVYRD